MTTAAIAVSGLPKRFGGLLALDDVAFSAQPGQVLGIIGVNGAGKTTLMNCVCGISKPEQGSILIDGHDTTGRAPHEVAHRGVGRTFQIPRVFRKMSLIDNLLVRVARHRSPTGVRLRRPEPCMNRVKRRAWPRYRIARRARGGR